MGKASEKSQGNLRPDAQVPNGMKQVGAGFAVGNVGKIMERSFKRRAARLAHSNAVLALAVLMTVSALFSLFRPYILPVNFYLTVERGVMAGLLWTVYVTGGKRGMAIFAWLAVIAAIMAVFFAAFIVCGMFAMQLLFTNQDDMVRAINGAGMWAFVPALLFLAVSYCIFLFKRHERLVCCNLRDSLRYGFAFDRGSYVFARNCLIVAVAMPVLFVIRGLLGDFSGIELLSDGARKLFNDVLPMGKYYWFSIVGVLVHSAAMLLSGAILVKYAAMTKKYKEQAEACRAHEKAAREGVKEAVQLEGDRETELISSK